MVKEMFSPYEFLALGTIRESLHIKSCRPAEEDRGGNCISCNQNLEKTQVFLQY